MKIGRVSFASPPVLQWYEGKYWLLNEPFKAWVEIGSGRTALEVPRLFKTDLASVPRPLWSIFPPEGNYTPAAIVHDYLYAVYGRVPNGLTFLREDCDAIFLSAMKELGVSWIVRRTIWLAVRAFGGALFDNHKPKG